MTMTKTGDVKERLDLEVHHISVDPNEAQDIKDFGFNLDCKNKKTLDLGRADERDIEICACGLGGNSVDLRFKHTFNCNQSSQPEQELNKYSHGLDLTSAELEIGHIQTHSTNTKNYLLDSNIDTHVNVNININ
eukprot:CAMPEP_0116893560 /NCGR_PEP_ID=MMETSP0467-20121206/3517_1 /TAXON_ID=283647 /ORGANISM="Mesodinium pulex, Strain SPMC105" /LENGTH=133 /DNA_ID=CAMNT_0004563279 /DNA_START=2089 /DNA_END=2486 /DNA_ORIENTATION=-